MIESEDVPDLHRHRHNAMLLFAAALFLDKVNPENREVHLELEALVRRLDNLGFTSLNSGVPVQSKELET